MVIVLQTSFKTIFCRTDRYRHSIFPDSVVAWNGIGPELRGAKSISVFKKNILNIIRPVKKGVFNIQHPNGIKWIFQLRVGLSPLKSHKKSHGFMDTQNDLCECLLNAESTHHFLIKCPNYLEQRRELFKTVNPILQANNINNYLNDEKLLCLLLYGDEKFPFEANKTLLLATINVINKSMRFSPP